MYLAFFNKKNVFLQKICVMKKLFITFNLLVFIFAIGFSQISSGGFPRSLKENKSYFKEDIPVQLMEYVDVEALKAEDAIVDKHKDRPWRFGENIYVDIDVKDNSVVTPFDNGKVYRMAIKSEDAVSINLTFDNFHLPKGADLFVYTKDQREIIGAFTEANNQADKYFSTTLLFADEIILEYYEPNNVEFPGTIHLNRVTHGYRSTNEYLKTFGQAGSCQVNVACSTGTGWDEQIRSACMLVVGGSGFCSGALINNTANDGKPYILTANHCYDSGYGSWVFWFNWQSPTCANPSSSPAYNSISGSTLKARSKKSDFLLLEMNSTPPASYNPYYAGWNRNTTPATSSMAIHHPAGDIKKISNGNAPTVANGVDCGNGAADCWKVYWSGAACTEGGSSGSPLFDQNKLIIGQLYGGASYCNAPASSMYDVYGRMDVSWDGEGTNSTRVSNWLDPSNTGVTTLQGYDPFAVTYALDAQLTNVIEPVGSSCGLNTITPKVTMGNRGTTTITSATIYYQVDNLSIVSQNWTGSLAQHATATITFPSTTVAFGNHNIKFWVSSPNGGTDENLANDTAKANFALVDANYTAPFTETFENASFPPSCWESFIGTNGAGPTNNWTSTTNAYQGSGAAYVKYNVDGGLAEDWLVTPKIKLKSNSKLSFYQKQSYSPSYGSTYHIYVSKTSQNNHASFTEVVSYGESTFSTSYTIKEIDLSAYDNQDVYIAFVMKNEDGDNWFIDNISISGEETAAPNANFSIPNNTACVNSKITLTDLSTNSPTSWNWEFTPNTVTFTDGTSANSQNPTVQFNAAGTYSVKLTCSNSIGSDVENKIDAITISNPPAQPSAISGNLTPCPNATAVNYSVTNVSGVNYTWEVPTGWNITAGNGTNQITVTVGNNNGTIKVTPNKVCDGTPQTATATLIEVSPISLGADTTICIYNSITLDAGSGFVSYLWSPNSETTQTITLNGETLGLGAHTISVTATNSSDCIVKDEIIITVDACSGIEENNIIGSIYPNPANEAINILFPSNQTDIRIVITDIAGKQVLTKYVESISQGEIINLPVSNFSKGTYTVNIISKHSNQTNLIIIN